MANIIDMFKKALEGVERTEEHLRELRKELIQNKKKVDELSEDLERRRDESRDVQRNILKRLESQQELLLRLETEMNSEEPAEETEQSLYLKEILKFQQESRLECIQLSDSVTDTRTFLLQLEKKLTEEVEERRREDLSSIKKYLKALTWLVLIVILLVVTNVFGLFDFIM